MKPEIQSWRDGLVIRSSVPRILLGTLSAACNASSREVRRPRQTSVGPYMHVHTDIHRRARAYKLKQTRNRIYYEYSFLVPVPQMMLSFQPNQNFLGRCLFFSFPLCSIERDKGSASMPGLWYCRSQFARPTFFKKQLSSVWLQETQEVTSALSAKHDRILQQLCQVIFTLWCDSELSRELVKNRDAQVPCHRFRVSTLAWALCF